MDGDIVFLTWNHDDKERRAVLTLPHELDWRVVRGEVKPPLGWYSEGFGKKEPTICLIGRGVFGRGRGVTTRLQL
jgi:hypothetical protein